MLLGNLLEIMAIAEGQMNDPEHHADADHDEEHGHCKASITPRVGERNIVKLPEPKE